VLEAALRQVDAYCIGSMREVLPPEILAECRAALKSVTP
jgi:hypothetical protein